MFYKFQYEYGIYKNMSSVSLELRSQAFKNSNKSLALPTSFFCIFSLFWKALIARGENIYLYYHIFTNASRIKVKLVKIKLFIQTSSAHDIGLTCIPSLSKLKKQINRKLYKTTIRFCLKYQNFSKTLILEFSTKVFAILDPKHKIWCFK